MLKLGKEKKRKERKRKERKRKEKEKKKKMNHREPLANFQEKDLQEPTEASTFRTEAISFKMAVSARDPIFSVVMSLQY